ncbi:MAG: LysM peptidoglycan-binding domain-containing protein [Microbacterium sp.]
MSTIELAPRPVVSTRLRLTARGRRVLAALAAAPVVVAVALAVLGNVPAAASGDDGAAAGAFETVTVSAGDTLWSIAEDVAPDADPRDVVDAIMRLNALDDATVIAGERLAIPAQYADR